MERKNEDDIHDPKLAISKSSLMTKQINFVENFLIVFIKIS